jgi:hypothetical protein
MQLWRDVIHATNSGPWGSLVSGSYKIRWAFAVVNGMSNGGKGVGESFEKVGLQGILPSLSAMNKRNITSNLLRPTTIELPGSSPSSRLIVDTRVTPHSNQEPRGKPAFPFSFHIAKTYGGTDYSVFLSSRLEGNGQTGIHLARKGSISHEVFSLDA